MSGSGVSDLREHLERVDDERRLAAARLRRVARDADDVAEVNVDLAGAVDRAEELDPAGAVDEVEEDELPHLAAREDATGEPPLLGALDSRLEALGLARTPRSRRGRESASALTARD